MRERAAWLLERPLVAAARGILDRYDAAGGGLLAGGLAYAALFALVPAVILLVGVVGLVLNDPIQRDEVVGLVVQVMPPLRELIDAVTGQAARDAGAISLLGGAILLWGASRFVVAFQDAIARVMGGSRRRGLIISNVAAILAVVLLIGALLVGALAGGLLAFLEAGRATGVLRIVGDALTIALGLMPYVVTSTVMVLIYRIVPVSAPPWRAVIVPGIGAGLAVALLAQVFVYLAPRLIGAAALLGTLAAVFAALAWLSLSFQAVLLGAAWVRVRADRGAPPGAKPAEALASEAANRL